MCVLCVVCAYARSWRGFCCGLMCVSYKSIELVERHCKAFDVKVDEYDAVIVPGGFGAAKNLSNLAFAGPECTVNEDLQRALKQFHAAKKPIGLVVSSELDPTEQQ